MRSIANRFAASNRTAAPCVLAIAALICAAPASAQTAATTKPPAPATWSGCVQKAPGSSTALILSAPTACATLSGKLSAAALAGHHIELKGILTPRTPSAPASIQVQSVVSIGKACTDVCSLNPPGTRGLQRPQQDAIPGSEGGTPGAVAQPHR